MLESAACEKVNLFGALVNDHPVLILASASPRRRGLLGLVGLPFEVLPAHVDETPLPGEHPSDYVLRIAQAKAHAVGAQLDHQAIIIAADTTVAHQGRILGKPVDAADALAMLQRLRGEVHQVFTALAVLRLPDGALLTDLATTDVPMRAYSQDEMQAYIASGDPYDKAGAYAIQHQGFNPVANLHGCYANVVGLPLCHLLRTLAKLDLAPSEDVPLACQNELNYRCPVFQQVLQGE